MNLPRSQLEGRRGNGLSKEAAASLINQGFVIYHEIAATRDQRASPRVKKRLHSAKLIDADNVFLTEAVLHDVSAGGMRLVLAHNIGLPARFGVHDDQNETIYTVSSAWRRGLTVGVRIHSATPPRPIKPVERATLRGRYYAVRG